MTLLKPMLRAPLWGSLALGLLNQTPVIAAEPSLETWILEQTERSLQALDSAISPLDGARGSVMASPSRSEPNYYFHWVRDAALVMREVGRSAHAARSKTERMLREYAEFSRMNQLTPNPSGNFAHLGLGEPKFNMDGSAFLGPWGRPQNDGPALRAITLIEFANDLIESGRENEVRVSLYRPELPANSVIKADLEFVAHHWSDPSFDLWEEVLGDHFYTQMTQRRALLEGAGLARRLGDLGAEAHYRSQSQAISRSLEAFWSEERGYILTTLNQRGGHVEKISNLDVAVVLASIQVGAADQSFSVADPRVLATVQKLVVAFENLYSINRLQRDWHDQPMAPGAGRYTEDTYDGVTTHSEGNPWFISTHALAEHALRLRNDYLQKGRIDLDPLTRDYLRRFSGVEILPSKRAVLKTDRQFDIVLKGLETQADAWIRRSRYHTSSDGHQSEQFNRNHGLMQGARDLTWSYASFLSLNHARSKKP